ncbi:sugar nucleotide-binding protein [Haematospirillum sp. H1815]|uniref:SDR family oxidoreductase n=1 Tax=Haematospirillum sp. H1815 TaxID=2723108 RepID=UPI00143BC912|nr:sugar nucleotide-binding protein [Haematospirillum sp. H1815]NKD76842.1 sugar nucleotide-binding protein [Haematospirillum sp. H1815]
MADDVLIIGASGFIGGYLFDHLGDVPEVRLSGTAHRRAVSGLHVVDIRDRASMTALLSDVRPRVVIFLAGTKDVDRCEREPAHAMDLNVGAIRHYIDACAVNGLRPVTLYVSTDYVFGGCHGSYGRDARVGPATVYGLSKLLAERLLQASGLPGQILRVSAVMGRRGGFFRWFESEIRTGTTLTLFDNTYFSPTSIGRLCSHVRDFVQCRAVPGTCNDMTLAHLSDGCRMSRYEFGVRLAELKGVPVSRLQAGTADLVASTFQADLSLLPDGMTSLGCASDWKDLENVF